AKQLLFLVGGQENAFDDDVDEQPVQDLALNVDNVFQAEDCDAFDSDVVEAPTTQTMFMANLSLADLITDEAGPSYDSDILSEYVKDNEVLIVHSDASSVPNDAFMMIYKDMEQVKLYKRRAKFELTKQEQKINEQLRLVISHHNFKEETLKRELVRYTKSIGRSIGLSLKPVENQLGEIKAQDLYLLLLAIFGFNSSFPILCVCEITNPLIGIKSHGVVCLDLCLVLISVSMSGLADKAILSGADNRPLMLEKDMYDSWRSRMELYMLNRQHDRMILESVEHGPLL
nr:retrovirus-related Pol polyprotein from transposon TNT 1-94 [Tanacetum cinerariifolium]